MDANTKKRYDKAGPQVVKALEKRHFEAYYVSTAAEAVEKVVELDPQGAHGVLGRHRHGGRTGDQAAAGARGHRPH